MFEYVMYSIVPIIAYFVGCTAGRSSALNQFCKKCKKHCDP